MARPTLFNHRKFRSLSMKLGSRALALGTLELIWACGYDSGDPIVGNSDEVEFAADWKGEKGALSIVLVETGFLDDCEGILSIHDLHHHAPDYVQRRFRREKERVQAIPKKRKYVRTNVGQCTVTVQPPRDGGSANVVTPSPSPSPSPKGSTTLSAFEIFYKAYPKKQSRADAEKAWKNIKPEDVEKILAALEWQKKSNDWVKDGGKYIPQPARYLNARKWEDEPQQQSLGSVSFGSGGNYV